MGKLESMLWLCLFPCPVTWRQEQRDLILPQISLMIEQTVSLRPIGTSTFITAGRAERFRLLRMIWAKCSCSRDDSGSFQLM